MSSPQLTAIIIAGTAQAHAPEPALTVAIVADRRLSVAALTALLLRDPMCRVVGEVRGTAEVRTALTTFQPALVVVDSAWPGTFALVDPSSWSGRILVLLDPDDHPASFALAIRAHAHGYLSRGASAQTLGEAVRAVREIGAYLDPLLVGRILRATKEAASASTTAQPELTRRERDILVRIASGRSTKEIAREYAITPKTVGNHVVSIRQKLKLRHRGELVLYAAHEGLPSL